MLKHASEGGLTQQDWTLLVTRDQSRLGPVERQRFDDAVSLYTTCAAVEEHNLQKLLDLNQPCARILARHDGGAAAKNVPSDDASGLEPEIFVACNAKVMLTRNIWQKKGKCSVRWTSNGNVGSSAVGLVNGAIGRVEDVVWMHGSTRSELPLAILVSFPSYTGPTLWRTEPRPGFPDGVPIVPLTSIKSTFNVSGKQMSRTQVPLRLAWAVTVHKSQGLTLERIKLGLGKKEFCSGLTFVALSRVKSLDSVMLVEKVDFSRVQKLAGKGLQERMEDIARRYHQNIYLLE